RRNLAFEPFDLLTHSLWINVLDCHYSEPPQKPATCAAKRAAASSLLRRTLSDRYAGEIVRSAAVSPRQARQDLLAEQAQAALGREAVRRTELDTCGAGGKERLGVGGQLGRRAGKGKARQQV